MTCHVSQWCLPADHDKWQVILSQMTCSVSLMFSCACWFLFLVCVYFSSHAASRIHGQCSNLFKHPSPTIASSLATDQPKVSDSYLSFAHRQSVLTIPLLAWLVNLAELLLSRKCGVAVLAQLFSTLSLLRLNIYCLVYIDFPVTVFLLSCSVPKSRNVNCWLIDWLLLAHEVHPSSKKK